MNHFEAFFHDFFGFGPEPHGVYQDARTTHERRIEKRRPRPAAHDQGPDHPKVPAEQRPSFFGTLRMRDRSHFLSNGKRFSSVLTFTNSTKSKCVKSGSWKAAANPIPSPNCTVTVMLSVIFVFVVVVCCGPMTPASKRPLLGSHHIISIKQNKTSVVSSARRKTYGLSGISILKKCLSGFDPCWSHKTIKFKLCQHCMALSLPSQLFSHAGHANLEASS